MQATLPQKKFVKGNLFSQHFLENKVPTDQHWSEINENSGKAYEQIKNLYHKYADSIETWDEDQLENDFLRPILGILGHYYDVQPRVLIRDRGITYKPDYALFENHGKKEDSRRYRSEKDSDAYFKRTIGIAEAKKWGIPLDKGRKQNPAVQIKKYLKITEIPWGILTNGQFWRIYPERTGFSSNVYYEVNLQSLLEHGDKEDFKYFYAFFARGAFTKVEEQSFLDRIYEEGVKFSKGLEDDLRDNIYEALKLIADGFMQKNPSLKEDLDHVRTNTLIFLYRLLFISYAEARNLLPLDNDIYRSYSLQKIREEIADKKDKGEMIPPTITYWDRLNHLFDLLNRGSIEVIGKEHDFIPPYNGGLFKENEFFDNNNLQDNYLAEGIELLSRRAGEGGKGFVDYSSLTIRHLGSIYEGLLEYKLKFAETNLVVEKERGKELYREAKEGEEAEIHKDDIYLVTDKGERKATGSYYTPDYIVKYIVENTVGPIVEEKIEKAREENRDIKEELLNISILDPAMGSGHFLVEATNFLSNKIIEHMQDSGEYGEIPELNDMKREVVERCIYGVDMNPLAVELAKVSLWLDTVSRNKALSFLDHHLQCGNSLIGASFGDITYVLPSAGKKKGKKKRKSETKGSQVTIFSTAFNSAAREMIKKRMEIESIPSNTAEDVKKKEVLNKEANKLRGRFKEVLDLYVSHYFGNEVPPNEFNNLALSINTDEETWKEYEEKGWFKNALKISEEKKFFNWELRFPEIFFGEYGSIKDNPGFDAVVGNPPYVDSEEMTRSLPEERDYCVNRKFKAASGNWDIFCIFIEQGVSLVRHEGFFGYIVPNKLLAAKYTLETQNIIKKYALRKLRDYSRVKVFEINVYPIIPIIQKSAPLDNHIIQVEVMEEVEAPELPLASFENDVRLETFSKLPEGLWSPLVRENFPIIQRALNISDPITKYCDVVGAATVSEAYELQNILEDIIVPPKEEYSKFINTGTIDRYSSLWGNIATDYIKKQYRRPIVRHRNLRNISEKRLKEAKSSKVIVAGMTQRLEAFYDPGTCLAGKSTVLVLPRKLNLKFLTSCMNSKLLSFVYRELFESLSLQGGYLRIGPPQIKRLPIRQINFSTLEKERQKLVKELKDLYANGEFVKFIRAIDSHLPKDDEDNFIKEKEKSDVVHDILVFLSEQMIDMKNQEHEFENALDLLKYLATDIPVDDFSKLFKEEIKYARVLEDASILNEPHDVNDLRLNKKEGRWIFEIELKLRDKENPKSFLKEGNRIKKERYNIYVFDMDDTKAEYYRAIIENLHYFRNVKIPGGYKKSANKKLSSCKLPIFDNDKARKIRPYLELREELLELKENIAKTDWLIDQIVYKLYGLNNEEIRIIEESMG